MIHPAQTRPDRTRQAFHKKKKLLSMSKKSLPFSTCYRSAPDLVDPLCPLILLKLWYIGCGHMMLNAL